MVDSNLNEAKIGDNTILSKNIQIGKNVTIGNNVIIHEDVIINDNVVILDNSIIGCKPKPRKSSSNKTKSLFQTIIGKNVFVGYYKTHNFSQIHDTINPYLEHIYNSYYNHLIQLFFLY